jgi:hypothetical protein
MFDILGGIGGLYGLIIFLLNFIVVRLVELKLDTNMANRIF